MKCPAKRGLIFLLLSTYCKQPPQINTLISKEWVEMNQAGKKTPNMDLTFPLENPLSKENNSNCPVSNHPEPLKVSTAHSDLPPINHNKLQVKLPLDTDVVIAAKKA